MTRQLYEEPIRPYLGEIGSTGPVTGGTSEVNLWTVATYSAFAANQVNANEMWHLDAWGVGTWPASPGTTILTLRYGQSATPSSNTTFGASSTITGINLSAVPWVIRVDLHIRTLGTSGTASCVGTMQSEGLTGKAAIAGGTVATIDTTAAAGLAVSVTPSVSGQSFTPQGVVLSRRS